MTITELIAKLEQLKNEHGDVKVVYVEDEHCNIRNVEQIVPRYPYKAGQVEDKTQPLLHVELF